MSDISDLHGVIPSSARWNAEGGVLGRTVFDEATVASTIAMIELGSSQAKFVMDFSCRDRGYGRIRAGSYDMRLTAVGASPPPWPGDDEFKPAIGVWLWNPFFGELRLETNQSTLLRAITGVWDSCRNYREASDGKEPVIFFEDRREQYYPTLGKTFWAPVIRIIGWCDRAKVPPFALRQPTVSPPPALDSQIPFTLLEDQRQERPKSPQKRGASPKQPSIGKLIDDELPDDPLPF